MDEKQAAALRAPFPADVIGKLPRGGVMLDYVGHAATTDRLLQVDPAWTWEPFALDERGLPAVDKEGNLWIRLTVAGVTRIGVGDGANGKGMKEAIGDAIRNAAMRFGVALDLWSKEDLDALHREPVHTADPEWVDRMLTDLKTAPDNAALGDLGKKIAQQVDAGRISDADRDALATAFRHATGRVNA